MQDNKSQALIRAHSVKGQMSFCHGALVVVCLSTTCQNRCAWDLCIVKEPQTRSDHRRIVHAIQEYDTTVDLVIFACSNFREFFILGLFTSLEFEKILFSLVVLL